ncbi:MAG: tripartite tricarboxylate transporter TctB family protein [Desulfobacteraceae bacterium]|nr:MAG: tripartite tricarboxylate transporter TctB family protein [Desulfobacteraceae bacterium]
MIRAERIGAFVVLLLGAGYLWEALVMEQVTIGDPLGPKVFPVILGVLMTALGFSLLIRPVGTSPSETFTRPAACTLILAVLLCVYGFAIGWIGYPVATFLFLFLGSRLLGEKSWVKCIVIPLALSMGVFGLFTRVLEIQLPPGILRKLLE